MRIYLKKSLSIPKGYSDVTNRGRGRQCNG